MLSLQKKDLIFCIVFHLMLTNSKPYYNIYAHAYEI